MTRAVLATFRPKTNDVAVFVDEGHQNAAVVLSLDEARKIHGAIGQALALAEHRDNPRGAVAGEYRED